MTAFSNTNITGFHRGSIPPFTNGIDGVSPKETETIAKQVKNLARTLQPEPSSVCDTPGTPSPPPSPPLSPPLSPTLSPTLSTPPSSPPSSPPSQDKTHELNHMVLTDINDKVKYETLLKKDTLNLEEFSSALSILKSLASVKGESNEVGKERFFLKKQLMNKINDFIIYRGKTTDLVGFRYTIDVEKEKMDHNITIELDDLRYNIELQIQTNAAQELAENSNKIKTTLKLTGFNENTPDLPPLSEVEQDEIKSQFSTRTQAFEYITNKKNKDEFDSIIDGSIWQNLNYDGLDQIMKEKIPKTIATKLATYQIAYAYLIDPKNPWS